MRRSRERGYTLVELMITVAIIGVLAALAITGMRKYLASARTAEALQMVGGISRAAVVQYERERVGQEANLPGLVSGTTSHALCGTATPVPASVPVGKYQPRTGQGYDFNAGDDTTGWPCLRFTTSGPIAFRYQYKAGGGMVTVVSSTSGGSSGGSSSSSSSSSSTSASSGTSGSSGSGIASLGGSTTSSSGSGSSGSGKSTSSKNDDDDDHDKGDKDDDDDHHDKGDKDDDDDHDKGDKDDKDDKDDDDKNKGKATATATATVPAPKPTTTTTPKKSDDDDDKNKGKGSFYKRPNKNAPKTVFAALTIPLATGASFEASAQGDQDGDGMLSTFSLTGDVNPATGMLRLATSIFVDQETE